MRSAPATRMQSWTFDPHRVRRRQHGRRGARGAAGEAACRIAQASRPRPPSSVPGRRRGACCCRRRAAGAARAELARVHAAADVGPPSSPVPLDLLGTARGQSGWRRASAVRAAAAGQPGAANGPTAAGRRRRSVPTPAVTYCGRAGAQLLMLQTAVTPDQVRQHAETRRLER
jgi:hypothetical protein